jgi:hypothetical protein
MHMSSFQKIHLFEYLKYWVRTNVIHIYHAWKSCKFCTNLWSLVTLYVRALRNTQKTLWTLGPKIFYIYNFFKLRVIGKHGKNDIGWCWKGPKIIAFRTMKGTKKTIIGAKNVNVLELMKIKFPTLELMKIDLISWIIYVMLHC